ncbi:predicted protein [Streptomyces iranensis]|uniref:Uncharacterized protein n=1 Tax=Streptomyces iranensis TaxID=576784 RepID=A0A060ZVE2_9ACTN|nr:predicted protein [Streptomyces iranensis]
MEVLVGGQVSHLDLQQIVVVSGDVMHLDDAWQLHRGTLERGDIAPVVPHKTDASEHSQATPDGCRIDLRMVAADRSRFLQPIHAPQAG